jgi:hypothetical protein
MTNFHPFALIVIWGDGEREKVSDHPTLQTAAREAFELADRLSLPGATRRATEVAILRDEVLQVSVTIIPGQALDKAND